MNDFESLMIDVITQKLDLNVKFVPSERCPICGGCECFCLIQTGKLRCFWCDEDGDIDAFLEKYKKEND